jgi:hypothetical protein
VVATWIVGERRDQWGDVMLSLVAEWLLIGGMEAGCLDCLPRRKTEGEQAGADSIQRRRGIMVSSHG